MLPDGVRTAFLKFGDAAEDTEFVPIVKSAAASGTKPPESPPRACVQNSSPGRTRTSDQSVNSRLLYQLSYRGLVCRDRNHTGISATTRLMRGQDRSHASANLSW